MLQTCDSFSKLTLSYIFSATIVKAITYVFTTLFHHDCAKTILLPFALYQKHEELKMATFQIQNEPITQLVAAVTCTH